MSDPVLLVDVRDEVALVTLNRPQAMNALSRELRGAIAETFDRLNNDPGVRAAILTGAGKAFCAGLDLKELGSGSDSVSASVETQDPVTSLNRFTKPVIGAINGVAITGGFELALACDILICTPEARFADTHGRVGILPGWGLSVKLPRLVGMGRAKLLSLTGNFLSAAEAERWGLVARVLPDAELLPAARALARDMLGTLPHMLPAMKRLMDEGQALPYPEALAHERATSEAHRAALTGAAVGATLDALFARGKAQKEG
jgi:enoyl-CoA hydratase